MKNRTFDYTKIEICRNCHGAGFVVGGYNAQVAPVCPVCKGSGRVMKHVNGSITITACSEPDNTDPYEGCFP